ncbi:MAG: hypothetical protein AUI36_37885 [Cyanobacteria bacterium 13_1_40CM_2_61_4]|nr:MAG: hypothetical protein AUI36_37885 [Cyanobacteria bacterium 13_1_40CM_2_61_4]
MEKAVRRLAQERIERALANLHSKEKLEGIHRVRMEIKKLRSLLRLVRKHISRDAYDQGTSSLRKAARHLAATRDAHVTLKALNELLAHFKGQLSAHAIENVKRALQQRCRKELACYDQQSSPTAVARILRETCAFFKELRIRAHGWQALSPGVNWSYSRGRCCCATVLEKPTAENFHEWRKRVKDLWYQVRLLRPIWREQMCAMARELKTLSELIGDDHDLVLLRQAVAGNYRYEKDLKALGKFISARQQELRFAALALGTRFYVDKPRVFRERLGRYWKLWCSEKTEFEAVVRHSPR